MNAAHVEETARAGREQAIFSTAARATPTAFLSTVSFLYRGPVQHLSAYWYSRGSNSAYGSSCIIRYKWFTAPPLSSRTRSSSFKVSKRTVRVPHQLGLLDGHTDWAPTQPTGSPFRLSRCSKLVYVHHT